MGVKVREKVPGSGVWWIFITHGGRRKSKRVGSREAASRAAKLIEARLTLGQPVVPESKPVAPILKEYFNKFQHVYLDTAAVRHASRRNYLATFKHHTLPALGTKRLDEITRDDVKALVASLVEKGSAKDTIRLVVANLSAVLNHAIEARLIAHNPAIKMAKFFKEAKKKHEEISPLTADEVELFLGTAFEVFPDIYPVFLCAVHTGCRAGEIAGLQWGDVDFNGKFLMIRRGTGKLGTKTKTGKVRRVDASDELLNELDRMRRQRQAQYLAKGLNQIPEWVFCNREGNAMDMQNVSNRYFRPTLMKAGLQQRRFHDLRHHADSPIMPTHRRVALCSSLIFSKPVAFAR